MWFCSGKMCFVFRIAVLLLATETIIGLDTRRTVLFPDDSDENSDEFVYEKVRMKDHKKPTPKMTFRFNSTDVPCSNATMLFCEEQFLLTEYPSKHVEEVLENTDAQTYKTYFNKTLTNETLGVSLYISTDGSMELCHSLKQYVYPQLGMNVKNEWRFIINQRNYQQPIQIELCQRKNSKCNFNGPISSGWEFACVQKYTKIPLLSLDENGPVPDYFTFPSFCKCVKQRSQLDSTGNRRRN